MPKHAERTQKYAERDQANALLRTVKWGMWNEKRIDESSGSS